MKIQNQLKKYNFFRKTGIYLIYREKIHYTRSKNLLPQNKHKSRTWYTVGKRGVSNFFWADGRLKAKCLCPCIVADNVDQLNLIKYLCENQKVRDSLLTFYKWFRCSVLTKDRGWKSCDTLALSKFIIVLSLGLWTLLIFSFLISYH